MEAIENEVSILIVAETVEILAWWTRFAEELVFSLHWSHNSVSKQTFSVVCSFNSYVNSIDLDLISMKSSTKKKGSSIIRSRIPQVSRSFLQVRTISSYLQISKPLPTGIVRSPSKPAVLNMLAHLLIAGIEFYSWWTSPDRNRFFQYHSIRLARCLRLSTSKVTDQPYFLSKPSARCILGWSRSRTETDWIHCSWT